MVKFRYIPNHSLVREVIIFSSIALKGLGSHPINPKMLSDQSMHNTEMTESNRIAAAFSEALVAFHSHRERNTEFSLKM